MRILKYLFLILILLFVGASVFVTTQKADYNVERSEIIKSQKSTIFNFVSDFRNWETFYSSVASDESHNFKYPETTTGIGSTFSWTGSTSGSVKTISLKESESIFQKINTDGTLSTLTWRFKDTIGGTKVTLLTKGVLDFKSKVLAFFNGGITKVVGDDCEKSLLNLNKTLVYEINNYSIKINGLANKSGCFYLKQTLLCREKSVLKNIKIVMQRLKGFFAKNNIVMNGKPFVIYDRYDKINDLIKLSVCISVRDSIFISQGSDIQSGKLSNFNSVKATVIGDYSHCQKAWKNIDNFINKNNLEQDKSHKIIEVYVKSSDETKNPSKWITEVYVPIYTKPTAKKQTAKKPLDSISIPTPVNVDNP